MHWLYLSKGSQFHWWQQFYFYYKKSTTISISVLSFYRDKSYFTNPQKHTPECFNSIMKIKQIFTRTSFVSLWTEWVYWCIYSYSSLHIKLLRNHRYYYFFYVLIIIVIIILLIYMSFTIPIQGSIGAKNNNLQTNFTIEPYERTQM